MSERLLPFSKSIFPLFFDLFYFVFGFFCLNAIRRGEKKEKKNDFLFFSVRLFFCAHEGLARQYPLLIITINRRASCTMAKHLFTHRRMMLSSRLSRERCYCFRMTSTAAVNWLIDSVKAWLDLALFPFFFSFSQLNDDVNAKRRTVRRLVRERHALRRRKKMALGEVLLILQIFFLRAADSLP